MITRLRNFLARLLAGRTHRRGVDNFAALMTDSFRKGA